MREFPLELDPVLQTGLRRFEYPSRRTPMMFDLYNMKPTSAGIVPYEPLQNPFNQETLYLYGLVFDWPFPQLFIGSRVVLLASSDKIYAADPRQWDQLIPLTLYDADSPDDETTIQQGSGAWQFVDFGYTWFLTNGSDTVFTTGREEMFGGSQKVYVKHDMSIEAGCAHKGRMFLGGFNYNNFWNSTWQTFWNTWLSKAFDSGITFSKQKAEGSKLMPVDGNWIWWSSIGGGDILLWLLPTLLSAGLHGTDQSAIYSDTYDTDNPVFMEYLRKNEWSFSQLPVQGSVRTIKPLGDFIVCYTDSGVIALKPQQTEYAATMAHIPVPKMETIGIAHKGAVGGDLNFHLMLDGSGGLWLLDRNLQANYLGYREFFSVLLPGPVSISHSQDPRDTAMLESGEVNFGEFYLSTDKKSYVLNSKGLYETKQRVTSAHYFQGNTIGFVSQMDSEDFEGHVGIDLIDFQTIGLKTITGIQLRVTETREIEKQAAGLQVAIDYKTAKHSAWKTTAYKPVNREGYVALRVTGVDFRVRVKVDKFRKVAIGGLQALVQFGDGRFRRGPETLVG